MERKIRFICAQPATTYYIWQVEVMINNFIRNGIHPNRIDILCGINDSTVPNDWRKLANHYNYIRFFWYNDTREDKFYVPSIYFNLVKQHIKTRTEILDDVLFFHDCDIVFTRKVNFDKKINDNVWYLSNTNSYLNYDYIQQKGNDLYEKMCNIIGIDKLVPKLMNYHSGGAQYIVKNTTFEFWDKVEKDSSKLYRMFCENEPLYVKKNENDSPIQKWTAGMWSLLWNAWLFGNITVVDKDLDFCWATDHISAVDKVSILHNAGVTVKNKSKLFCKSDYRNELPYEKELEISQTSASFFYWNEICKTRSLRAKL